jgi:hypothetical protein
VARLELPCAYGKSTVDSAAACWQFQSLTASVTASRSSAKSEGEAIITRSVLALNGMTNALVAEAVPGIG